MGKQRSKPFSCCFIGEALEWDKKRNTIETTHAYVAHENMQQNLVSTYQCLKQCSHVSDVSPWQVRMSGPSLNINSRDSITEPC